LESDDEDTPDPETVLAEIGNKHNVIEGSDNFNSEIKPGLKLKEYRKNEGSSGS